MGNKVYEIKILVSVTKVIIILESSSTTLATQYGDNIDVIKHY